MNKSECSDFTETVMDFVKKFEAVNGFTPTDKEMRDELGVTRSKLEHALFGLYKAKRLGKVNGDRRGLRVLEEAPRGEEANEFLA